MPTRYVIGPLLIGPPRLVFQSSARPRSIPAASALVAAPARYLLGDSFWRAVQGWFLGNAVTQVVVTPMLVYWGRRDFRERVGFTEAICASCGLTGTLFVSFLVDHSSSALMFMYLPIPFLVWVAVRLRPFGAANALALVAVVAVVAAVKGSAVFAGESPAGAVLSIQLFLLVVGLSILSLAIAVAEREALQAREATWNRRLIDAQDDERSRIASELHDDIGQQVALLLIDINGLAKSAEVSDSAREQLRTLGRPGCAFLRISRGSSTTCTRWSSTWWDSRPRCGASASGSTSDGVSRFSCVATAFRPKCRTRHDLCP